MKIKKDINSFNVKKSKISKLDKEKFMNDLKQNYGIEISYELLLDEQKKKQKQ